MAMNRQTYLEMVISFLSKLKSETGFNLDTPLDHGSRIKLSAVANSAANMGEAQIGNLIKRALESNDPKTQEILLYSGLSAGPISDKDIKSVLTLASEKLQRMGGSPDSVAAQAVEPPQQPEEAVIEPDGLADLLDEPSEDTSEEEPESEKGEDDESDPLADLMGDDEKEDSESDSEPEEDADADMPEDEDGDGRIAKEGEAEEIEDEPFEPQPQPMNDWFERFALD